MIKENRQWFTRLRVLADIFTLSAAYLTAYLFFFFIIPSSSPFGGSFSLYANQKDYLSALIYILPIHLCFYYLNRLYRPMRITGRRLEAFRIFRANLMSVLLTVIIFWLFVRNYNVHFSRMFLAEFGFLNTCAIIFERNIIRYIVMAYRKSGSNHKHILLVGHSKSAEAFLERVRKNPQWGYDIYGILDDSLSENSEVLGFKVIGKIGLLQEILEQNFIDEVFVTLSLGEYAKLSPVVSVCEKSGIMTKFVPDYGLLISNKPYTEELQGLPVVYIRQVPLNDMAYAFMKRCIDIFGAFFGIVLLSPLMIGTAIAVKISSPGPVIFKQERIGRHNKSFLMYKFRSMELQTEKDEEKGWTKKNDPRVTKVGKFIRKTNIDELPQLFNVLTGKMSLVGPRPERPQFVDKFKEEIPRYMVKHQVRPGMTGWAQVNGFRGDTSIEERINHDIFYIENWSLGLDIKILFMTFFKKSVNENAY